MLATLMPATPIRALMSNLAVLGERLRAGFRPRPIQTFATAVPRVAWRVAERLCADRHAVLEGEVLKPVVFGKTAGLLPVFAWHADQLARCAMGHGSGVYFEPERDSFTGYRCVFPTTPAFSASALLFLQESLYDAWQNLPRDTLDRVMLDDLVGLFVAAQRHPHLNVETRLSSLQP